MYFNYHYLFLIIYFYLEPPKRIEPERIEKHYVCLNQHCDNRCCGNHDLNHCYGFTPLYFANRMHCIPYPDCFQCNQRVSDFLVCHKCQSRYCIECFNKEQSEKKTKRKKRVNILNNPHLDVVVI